MGKNQQNLIMKIEEKKRITAKWQNYKKKSMHLIKPLPEEQ